MKEVLEKENLMRPLKVGEIVEGKVIGQGRSAVFLDLGAGGTGIIYGKEFFEAKEELKSLKKGDSVFAKIIDLENEDGYVELSMSGASEELSWLKLSQIKEGGEEISVKILGANKGGLICEVFGIQGFIPVSQLAGAHYPRVENGNQEKILRELQKFIGKELTVKIFDLSQREEKLILSEKAKATEKIKKLLEKYKVGDIVEGKITGITDFGAFLRFGEDLEGLIHISELDWKLIEDPAEVVKIGEKVKAKIIEISGNKVSLSLKALKKDPWLDIEKKYKKGDIVSGKVTKFNPFGAFVQIGPEIQGLCHISEFGNRGRMEAKLEIGKKYDFQILSIDSKEHRMSLKLVE